jgi:hexosaminidase
MWKSLALCCLGLLATLSVVCKAADISIIPKPQQLQVDKGSYVLDARTTIVAPGGARAREIASFLREAIQEQTGIRPSHGKSAHAIVLKMDPSVQGDEAYRLSVTTRHVTISAATDKGLFWGVQTLRQLLPLRHAARTDIPALHIEDAPSFPWRGVMLDAGRHFYPVSFIEKQLDVLSYNKINIFHWHLTEDQGWRIAIERYPALTEVGAWRIEADGSRYGGFYTQQQIRDIVEYARKRNITVIPEIEMPGHSTAALAAYPQLSCTRRPLQVPITWGVFEDVYCVGDEATFTFLQHVLDEVIDLFPAPYVHIGGDEVPKDRWKDCDSCQQLMHAQGLADEEGLQSYFIRRIQQYLAGKQRTLIGWDEILEGGADKNAIIEIWRGEAEGRKALASGNRIINAGPYYLDTPTAELGVKKIYASDPRQGYADAPAGQVLGAEAPLWSEYATPLNAENKLYPRVLAFAEITWNDGPRDYADFQRRLQAQYPWLDARQVNYGAEDQNLADFHVVPDPQGGWQLQARSSLADMVFRYSIDGSEPGEGSPEFTDTLAIRHAGTLQVTPFRHGRALDLPTRFTLLDNLASGKPITYAQPPSPRYSGSPGALDDGLLGSNNLHDGQWVGWEGGDLDASIDLQQTTSLRSIAVNFIQQSGSWVLPPRSVTFYVSADGEHWSPLDTKTPKIDAGDARPLVQRIEFASAAPISARYVRVKAENYGPLPADSPGAGHKAWLFSDEIMLH